MKSSGIRLYGGPNPGGVWDVALDEALLCCTHENHGPLTFRVWQSTKPVFILPRSTSSNEDTLFKECLGKKVSVTRSLRGRNLLLYSPGVLSFSVIDESKVLTSGDLEAEIGKLLVPIKRGLQSLKSPIEAAFNQDCIRVNDSIIGAYSAHYYFDYLLLQGMIIVHNNEIVTELMNSRAETQFSSLERIRNNVEINPLIGSVVGSISQYFSGQSSIVNASVQEISLMNDLYKWKYTTDDWIFHHFAPLALGRVLLEAYLAYPPTTRCREIMTVVDDLSKTHGEKVEVRTWLRGRGLVSWHRGVPPGLFPSGGVIQASKKSIVPAIIIEGKITHERTVPTYDDLCKLVERVYEVAFGGTTK